MAERELEREARLDAPWPVWGYFITVLASQATGLLAEESPGYGFLTGFVMALAIAVGVFMKAKVAWIIAIFFAGVAIIATLKPGSDLNPVQAVFAGTGLILLAMPAARSWCDR